MQAVCNKLLLQILIIARIANSVPNYVYVSGAKTWNDADAYCLSEYQSNLASIHSAEENAAVMALCETGHCWIGYTDKMSEGIYVTADGTPNDYFQGWCSGSPQNNGPADDCLGIYRPKGACWFDWYCTNIFKAFICNPIGSASCDMNQIDKECADDNDCPECLQCCSVNGVCEVPPVPATPAKSVVNDIMDESIAMDGVVAAHASKGFSDYYSYILLVGIILFVLINNIFIAYWCVCKKGSVTQTKMYEKCDVNIDGCQ